MRMKKTAGAVAISTLTLAGLGIAGATAAHADVWNVPCNTYHDASLTGGPTQCFKYSGSGNNVIEVDGYGQVCASSVYNVKVIYQGGATYTTRPGYCAPAGGIYQFYIGV